MSFSFSSPDILKGCFNVTLARDGTNWLLVTPHGNAFLESREIARLNYSTAPDTPTHTSLAQANATRNRPTFWFDSDWDRRPTPWSDLLAALLAIEPRAPIRRTGRTRTMTAVMGGQRPAVEVEVMMEESELCKVCYYCGDFDSTRNGPLEYSKIGGDGYTSTYSCQSCKGSFVRRYALRSKRTGQPPSTIAGLLQRVWPDAMQP
ncbi:hypothetical protein K438DRAFT_1863899 [Mycena galopus ATCC 62051]|nr:hypothetical protein K438DRAFT_1863899 [Mycena galopus ATCC 62051]